MEIHIPKVAIVLLSYNSLKLIKNFLPLIIETTPKTNEYEIVIVDNASEDETSEFLAENFPSLRVIRLKVNKGFTNGYVESLSKIQSKYYVLISSDIEVTKGWLKQPIELLESDQSIAAVQPKIMSYDMRDKFEYAGAAGGFIDFLGYPFCRGRIVDQLEVDEGQYDNVQEIFWASGACLFIRADLYHKAGGLDNSFYAHMEEIDLCWRLKGMGYKIMFAPTSKVFHMGGFIISYGSPGKVYRNHRNNLIMYLKNAIASEIIWKLPLRFIFDWLTFVKMILDGSGKASFSILKAHFHFLIYLPKWLKSRSKVQALKVNTPNNFGTYNKSIVWSYFIKGIRKFNALNWKP